MIFCRDGTEVDSIDPEVRSGAICLRSDTFSRGGLKGKLVSVPIMRCVAERCDRAETTWGELNAGFRGTYIVSQCIMPWEFPFHMLTRMAPSLNKAYVVLSVISQYIDLDQLCIDSISYHSKLNIIPQADSYSHALLDAQFLQSCCDGATPLV
jgi:hypothetical protein